jgi:hypothetical protein
MSKIQKPVVALAVLGATLLPLLGGPLARPAQARPRGRDLVIIGGIIAGYGLLQNNRNSGYGYGGNSHQRHDQQDEARRHGSYNNGYGGGYNGNYNNGYGGGYNGSYNNGYGGGYNGSYNGGYNNGSYGGNNGYYNGGYNNGYYNSNNGNRGHHHD